MPDRSSLATLLIAKDAVEKAVNSWGKASLTELEAKTASRILVKRYISHSVTIISLCLDIAKVNIQNNCTVPYKTQDSVTHTLQSTEILRRDIGSKRSRFDESISYVRGPHEMR